MVGDDAPNDRPARRNVLIVFTAHHSPRGAAPAQPVYESPAGGASEQLRWTGEAARGELPASRHPAVSVPRRDWSEDRTSKSGPRDYLVQSLCTLRMTITAALHSQIYNHLNCQDFAAFSLFLLRSTPLTIVVHNVWPGQAVASHLIY